MRGAKYWVVCNICGAKSPEFSLNSSVTEYMQKDGWQRRRHWRNRGMIDVCSMCLSIYNDKMAEARAQRKK